MWGSSFAELAKKAQEQASSLQEQASHLSMQSIQTPSVGGYFNLDAMQSNKETKQQQQKSVQEVPSSLPATLPTTTTTPVPLPQLPVKAASADTQRAMIPPSKLKPPVAAPIPMPPRDATHDCEEDLSVPDNEDEDEDGWSGDDDIDLDDGDEEDSMEQTPQAQSNTVPMEKKEEDVTSDMVNQEEETDHMYHTPQRTTTTTTTTIPLSETPPGTVQNMIDSTHHLLNTDTPATVLAFTPDEELQQRVSSSILKMDDADDSCKREEENLAMVTQAIREEQQHQFSFPPPMDSPMVSSPQIDNDSENDDEGDDGENAWNDDDDGMESSMDENDASETEEVTADLMTDPSKETPIADASIVPVGEEPMEEDSTLKEASLLSTSPTHGVSTKDEKDEELNRNKPITDENEISNHDEEDVDLKGVHSQDSAEDAHVAETLQQQLKNVKEDAKESSLSTRTETVPLETDAPKNADLHHVPQKVDAGVEELAAPMDEQSDEIQSIPESHSMDSEPTPTVVQDMDGTSPTFENENGTNEGDAESVPVSADSSPTEEEEAELEEAPVQDIAPTSSIVECESTPLPDNVTVAEDTVSVPVSMSTEEEVMETEVSLQDSAPASLEVECETPFTPVEAEVVQEEETVSVPVSVPAEEELVEMEEVSVQDSAPASPEAECESAPIPDNVTVAEGEEETEPVPVSMPAEEEVVEIEVPVQNSVPASPEFECETPFTPENKNMAEEEEETAPVPVSLPDEEELVEMEEVPVQDNAPASPKVECESASIPGNVTVAEAEEEMAPVSPSMSTEEKVVKMEVSVQDSAPASPEVECEGTPTPVEAEAVEPTIETDDAILTNAKETRVDGTNQPIPQAAIDRFMEQMRRMDESHQIEMREMGTRYETQLKSLRESHAAEKKKPRNFDVVSHDKCLVQMRQLEKQFVGELKEKDVELDGVVKMKEELTTNSKKLQLDLNKANAQLSKRAKDVDNARAEQSSRVQELEQQVKERNITVSQQQEKIQILQVSLSSSQQELESTNETYANLKSRVKEIATELKDRRQECRSFTVQVKELTDTNMTLETRMSNLQSQLTHSDNAGRGKDDEIAKLNTKVECLEKELKSSNKTMLERSAVSEKTLAQYKRKAQAGVATANARVATANQEREEAEMEVSAARAASTDAIERAKQAEAKCNEAEANANKQVRTMEAQLQKELDTVTLLQNELDGQREELVNSRKTLEDGQSARHALASQMQDASVELEQAQKSNSVLAGEAREERNRNKELLDEVDTLKEELEYFAMREKQNVTRQEVESSSDPKETERRGSIGDDVSDSAVRFEQDGAIRMLQNELEGANEAIRELKQALQSAIMKSSSSQDGDEIYPRSTIGIDGGVMEGMHLDGDGFPPPRNGRTSNGSGNASTPLFFALEKQSELNTARDEINRLANLLGDAESSKMEAYDAMDDMRRNMEEAEARLKRYEKLGSAAAGSRQSKSEQMAPNVGNGHGSFQNNGSSSDGMVNLEYLKNIMMRYLTAKSLAEKKALVPVVSAVLCLTAEEQAQASTTVEQSGGLEGVGHALFESFGSKVYGYR